MNVLPGLLMAMVLTLMAPAAARGADDAQPQARPAPTLPTLRQSPDFLLGAPRGWVGLRGSMAVPRAGGDLFTFLTDQLTLGRSDFRSRAFAADVGVVLTSKLDLVVGMDLARGTSASEYRRYVTPTREPISQTTRFRQTQISAGARYSPVGRGRRVSQYAFIPARFAPYLGAGLVTSYYSLSQIGEFVDFNDLMIFNDQFASDGWAVGPYVNGGVDVQVWKRLYLSFEGRYSWSHGSLGSDFSGFDGIDLAGFRGGTGIAVVF